MFYIAQITHDKNKTTHIKISTKLPILNQKAKRIT